MPEKDPTTWTAATWLLVIPVAIREIWLRYLAVMAWNLYLIRRRS